MILGRHCWDMPQSVARTNNEKKVESTGHINPHCGQLPRNSLKAPRQSVPERQLCGQDNGRATPCSVEALFLNEALIAKALPLTWHCRPCSGDIPLLGSTKGRNSDYHGIIQCTIYHAIPTTRSLVQVDEVRRLSIVQCCIPQPVLEKRIP